MKKYLPVVAVVGALIIIIGLMVLTQKEAVAPTSEVATTTEETTETPAQGGVVAAPKPGVTGTITNITPAVPGAWTTYTNPRWKISLKYDPSWSMLKSGNNDAQVSFRTTTLSIMVSRNTPIAPPQKLNFTTVTRDVAGKEVSVDRYVKPNETYALYEYFTLPVGTDIYYFQIKSTLETNRAIEEFLGYIKII